MPSIAQFVGGSVLGDDLVGYGTVANQSGQHRNCFIRQEIQTMLTPLVTVRSAEILELETFITRLPG